MKTEIDIKINPDTHLRENAVSGCTDLKNESLI